ncbi:hypothetical protein SPRG_07639 [Saprolegnia parasitica CBS 223.65]|uniref:Uncharacterized protein n=1 Tax=Saprolegnia parasitica (strain CBS 223.65) TaxID=695850 RepID=A0A067CCK9_SAPPC|nr:hypothetical protein SPRG_07639 [Saprolegnia parasitica CBS 223.65]KDO26925.1 hypothetical protein SPRG_07639 [Saprolegnia parasitica CBS 223.65]|eukprot:XP_012202307.1 hypothetical protein SPRG_07639 [Saprolegnia parasitica CBS 223.65]
MLPVLATDDRDARSLAITNVVLTPCCRGCRRFEAFLKSPTDSEWHIEWYEDSRRTWCATLEAFAAHLPMRLEVAITSHAIYPNVCVATFRKRLDNRDDDPEEVRPGHRARTLAKIARLREYLGEQNKHTSDDDGADKDGPPTKRVKPSESC